VQVAASGFGMISAASVQTRGFHGDGLAVGGRPVEDAIVLRVSDGGKNADEQRGRNGNMLHVRSICRVQAGA
jgi:hypothetical protein